MATRGNATRSERGWWESTRSEQCIVCHGLFDLEVEIRCADCDGPVCPLCAVSSTRETAVLVCGACTAEEEEEA